ncbi:hypothetical protein LG299_05755 [Microbacterium lacus]|uniref:hypothetical protein n=1 Tax=Microbacterium lacus TaxID=415217 RepID=UPI00384DC14D
MADLLAEWTDFHVAIVGATAALAGLVIVAASVNISVIVKSRTLTARLGSGIVMLVLALAVSAVALMPRITDAWFGAVMLGLAMAALILQISTARLLAKDPDPLDQKRWAKALIGFLPPTAYIVASALLLVDQPTAMFVSACGALIAIVAALVVSWVALVEVLR